MQVHAIAGVTQDTYQFHNFWLRRRISDALGLFLCGDAFIS